MVDNSTVFEPLSLRRPLWDPGRAGAFGIRAQRETAAPSAFEKETDDLEGLCLRTPSFVRVSFSGCADIFVYNTVLLRIGSAPETARPPFWKGDGGACGLGWRLVCVPSVLKEDKKTKGERT